MQSCHIKNPKGTDFKECYIRNPKEYDLSNISWFDNYKYRRKATITASKITEDLPKFPVLFDYSPTVDDYFLSTNSITPAITDENDNLVPFEIQHYTNKTELLIWLLLDLKKDQDNIFNFYYDTNKPNKENKSALWNDYNSVHHWEKSFLDSTNNHNAINNGTLDIQGKIGRARHFDNTDKIQIDNFNINFDFSLSFWFKTKYKTQADIIAITKNNHHGILVEVGLDGKLRFLMRNPTGSSGGIDLYSNITISDDTWHLATFIFDTINHKQKLYIDGILNAETANNQNIYTDFNSCVFGRLLPDNIARSYAGLLDEFRVYRGITNDVRINTEFENQNSPDTFYTIGAIEIL